MKVRVNIHGIITVASASLVEKKADAQSDSIEMENSAENVSNNSNNQEAPMETNGAAPEQPNGPENQEVREDGMAGEPQQRQSWTQRVGSWFSGVRAGSASVECLRGVC